MQCIIKYMIRKTWDGIVEDAPGCGLLVLFLGVSAAVVYVFEIVTKWLGADPELIGALLLAALIVVLIVYSIVDLYRKAKRHCATENEPACEHEFFQCQVPASDTCVPIYHWVCKKCRWDETRKMFMPPDIWRDWAVPQLEKMRRPSC